MYRCALPNGKYKYICASFAPTVTLTVFDPVKGLITVLAADVSKMSNALYRIEMVSLNGNNALSNAIDWVYEAEELVEKAK